MPCSPKPGWALLSPPGCCFAYRPARVEDWVEAALRLSLWHTRSSTLWQCWAKWYGRAYKNACMHMRRGLVLVSGAYMDERSLSLPASSMKTVCISLSCILFFFGIARRENQSFFCLLFLCRQFFFCFYFIHFFKCSHRCSDGATISSFPMVPASGFPNQYSRHTCIGCFFFTSSYSQAGQLLLELWDFFIYLAVKNDVDIPRAGEGREVHNTVYKEPVCSYKNWEYQEGWRKCLSWTSWIRRVI